MVILSVARRGTGVAGSQFATLTVLAAWLLVAVGCAGPAEGADPQRAPPKATVSMGVADGGIVVAPRAATIPTHPCSQCHDLRKTDPTVRELTEYHTTIELQHAEAMTWCDHCHTFDDLDTLHLADDTRVTFDESYRLCGECHGEKLRDWKSGAHGLQTGKWSSPPTKRTCTACHSSHAPAFAPLAPHPPPDHPRGFRGLSHPGTQRHPATGLPSAAPASTGRTRNDH